jgi:glycosyltransferase involved in cell wall biosynthesis
VNILIVNASDETVTPNSVKGGNQLLTEKLHEELTKRTDHRVDLELLRFDDTNPINLYRSYQRAIKYDASKYDAVISMKFPSFCVSHDKHLCLFNHRMKQFYSEWSKFHGSDGITKPVYQKIRDIIHRVDTEALSQTTIFAQSEHIAKRLKQQELYAEVVNPPPTVQNLKTKEYDYFLLPSRLEDKNKRISLAIHAFNEAETDTNLIITGDGPDKTRLERLAGPNISFTGFVPDEELRGLYAEARAVLFTGEDEDYGLTTIEAMKASKPVVTTSDSGGPLEFVENRRTGFVTEPKKSNLARVLSYLDDHRGVCEHLGHTARSAVQHIGWEAYVQRIEVFLESETL